MRWEVDHHEELGEIQLLEGHRSMATVRQEERLGHTVVTVSMLLPIGDIDAGKQAAERLMSTVIQIERSR